MSDTIEKRTIWQQAAGDKDRNYAKICLAWDVILNGPGNAGNWPNYSKDISPRKVADLRRFAEEMKDGDIVILRLGTSEVFGLGIVKSNYMWLENFGDVDGWDLQHARRVKWVWKNPDKPKSFPTYTLKQGDTTQKLKSDSKIIIEWINSLDINLETDDPLVELPEELDRSVEFDAVSEYLFDKGVSSASIEALSREINELIRIAKWYKKYATPSESETVAYLAVPLLKALGWTPQKMAIEWNNVDVALFNQLPRIDDNLSVVIEAKKKDRSCLTAVSQAQAYAEGKQNCKRLIVTDGLRYGVYLKRKNEFHLYAYFNITDLKVKYPIYGCHGVKEALQAMTPDWVDKI